MTTNSLFDRERPHDSRQALFRGRGTVRVWNLLARPEAPFSAVLACELDPDGSVGTHVQEHFPEIVIVISGQGSARVDGSPRALASGSVIELALGKKLALENSSPSEPLRYLIIKAQ